jgi:hypothetical protein
LYGPGYIAAIQGQPGSAAPVWEYQFDGTVLANQAVLGPDHTLTISRYGFLIPSPRQYDLQLTRFTGVPPLYEAPLCRTPPVANLAYTANAAGDELTFFEASNPGPTYAQVVRWQWQLGDGTYYDGRVPPPHTYAPVPAAGTALTLRVTNNLGCTHTLAVYPWGLPTATQQAQSLAAGAMLSPNPAGGGRVTLRLPGLAAGAAATVQVLDALGRAVAPAATLTGPQELALPVAGLAAGVYVVRVHTPQGSFAKRLVIAR